MSGRRRRTSRRSRAQSSRRTRDRWTSTSRARKNRSPASARGPVEVVGLRTVEKIGPNQKVSLEFGLKPKEAGTMDFDFEVHYTRPLDEGKHQTTDTAVVRVEPETGYLIDDGLLFHSTGALVCHETPTD